MNKQELEMLKDLQSKPRLSENLTLEKLKLPSDFTGTIAYGYNCERDTMHLYAENGVMTVVWYNPMGGIIRSASGSDLTISDPLADKRLYPERTLFEYSRYLLENDITPRTLTNFTEEKEMKKGEFGINCKRLSDFE